MAERKHNPNIQSHSVAILEADGIRFRDLDRDGKLTPYEDWRLSPEARAKDIVNRMNLAEKLGSLLHGTLPSVGPMGSVGIGPRYDLDRARAMIVGRNITFALTRMDGRAGELAAQHNRLQDIAEEGRLGIPLTISTDPRHHFQGVVGASTAALAFSKWPEATGLAAIGDPSVTRHFADIARQEYRAVGIRVALSPQADIASEPRWARANGTFGDDPDRVGRQVSAYIEGFQHGTKGVTKDSVVAVVKHWVGYGAAKNGFDSHSYYGRFAAIRRDALWQHIRPFEYAFRSNAGSIMPTYSILEGLNVEGKDVEQVGAGFNHFLVTELLRKRYGFKGVILSDWGVTEDCPRACTEGSGPNEAPIIGMPWGVEELPRAQRAAKMLNAGVDQIGGIDDGSLLVEAVQQGLISQDRIDDAARHVMAQSFALGLFEDPFVDVGLAESVVGATAMRHAGFDAQRRSIVRLEERRGILPLRPGKTRIYLYGMKPDEARRRGYEVVDDPAKADVAIVRTATPSQMLHPKSLFGRFQHEGDLDFKPNNAALVAIDAAAKSVPVIVDVYMDRPAILTNIRAKAAALFVNFGASDAALLDILGGVIKPHGRLPFELPSSMDAVRNQRSDIPHDSKMPLYPSHLNPKFGSLFFGRIV
ncbi:glycoside hydrolase family 3 protein [Sphingobium sp. AP50]|uniref:glycoside hydrolase family 3 protein n=1 Tax=Sphingobium sp. AP50 TaxID=1884369 RepID=UPI001C431525|nr:glycoside hydrolase family 3 N-terminal domain-containing protein [Sphingobium sp. AP50]